MAGLGPDSVEMGPRGNCSGTSGTLEDAMRSSGLCCYGPHVWESCRLLPSWEAWEGSEGANCHHMCVPECPRVIPSAS